MSKIYYVYVYIDPRNFEEFYYGKGTGDRKYAHLNDKSDTEKANRIEEIRRAGLMPIIRVIAKGLSDEEAFLVEKTLIWKLGKNLTNKAGGNYSKNFRPAKTMYKEIPGFDFQNDIQLMNVGEGPARCWNDCKKYGFMAAGQHPKYSSQLQRLNIGDVLIAYYKGRGYVGIGIVSSKPTRVDDFTVNGKPLKDLNLERPGIFINSENENSEFLVQINWINTCEKIEAKWKKNHGLFANQGVCVSMQNQPKSIEFIEKEFNISLKELLRNEQTKLKAVA